MLSTSVERAPGKHVKSTGGTAWASKCNNQTAKSSGGGSNSGSGGGSGSGSHLGGSGRGGGAGVAVVADDEITGGITKGQFKDGRKGRMDPMSLFVKYCPPSRDADDVVGFAGDGNGVT